MYLSILDFLYRNLQRWYNGTCCTDTHCCVMILIEVGNLTLVPPTKYSKIYYQCQINYFEENVTNVLFKQYVQASEYLGL